MFAQDSRRPLTGQHGFSMVELLIGMSITLVVLATTLGALTDGLKMSDTAKLLTQMQHNARSGLKLVTRDLMQTGQGIPKGGITIPNGAGASLITRPGPGSLTYPAGTVVLPAVTTGQGLGGVVQGRVTDIISVIYADATLALNAAPLLNIPPDGSLAVVDPITDITDPGTGIQAGDFIMFSNAMGSAIQEVTSVADQTVVVRLHRYDGPQSARCADRVHRRSAGWTWNVSAHDGHTYLDGDLLRGRHGFRLAAADADPQQPETAARRARRGGPADHLRHRGRVSEPGGCGRAAAAERASADPQGEPDADDPLAHRAAHNRGEYHYQTLKTQVSLRSLSFIDRYQ